MTVSAAPREEDQGRDPEPSSAGVGRGLRWWQQDGWIGGVGLQIIRDWVLRFNARGPDGLVDGKSPGAPSKLNADHRRALAEVVEAGPVPAVDGVVRWRRKDLARWLLETFAISLDETTVGRELKALGFAKISARPRHYAQNELAVEAFKKNFPAELAKIRARLPKGVEIELWWQDEARIGQKNKLTRRWARRGTRPRAPRDQRTEWAYIFGAICPAKGKGAGLVMPWCDTDAMAAHLIEISAAVDPGAHAVLIVDQAGWHLTPKLAIPDNITVLALPPRSPELNPVENVWQFMRDNWLSNRIFKSYEDIVALCCQAWNNLIDQPWKIMSLGMRKWAHGFRSMTVGIRLFFPKIPKKYLVFGPGARMDDDAIERAAALLLAAQRDHEQLRELPRSCRPDTLAEAYAIQARFVAGLGGAPVGYKVAASNPAIQKRFNITAPLSGRLIEGRVFTSPATIDPSALFRIGIETEYAFRMGRDLPPAGAPYGRERVAEAVAALVPAIEVVDWRFANATAIGALLMVTDNAFGAYWVAGAAIADWRDLEIVHAEVVTRIGGTLVFRL